MLRAVLACCLGLALATPTAGAVTLSATQTPATLDGPPPYTITDRFELQGSDHDEHVSLSFWKGAVTTDGPATLHAGEDGFDDGIVAYGCLVLGRWTGQLTSNYDVDVPANSTSHVVVSYTLDRYPFLGEQLDSFVGMSGTNIDLPGPAVHVPRLPFVSLGIRSVAWGVPLPTDVPLDVNGQLSRGLAGQQVELYAQRGGHRTRIARVRVQRNGRFRYFWRARQPGRWRLAIAYRGSAPGFAQFGPACSTEADVTDR